MKHDLSTQRMAVAILMFLVVGALPGVAKALQTPSIDDTLGKWVSAERFDEGTIGWELRVSTPTTATLSALTEDGLPINDDDLRWDMSR